MKMPAKAICGFADHKANVADIPVDTVNENAA